MPLGKKDVQDFRLQTALQGQCTLRTNVLLYFHYFGFDCQKLFLNGIYRPIKETYGAILNVKWPLTAGLDPERDPDVTKHDATAGWS